MGADPLASDGAGLLLQLPDALLRTEADRLGIPLPALGFVHPVYAGMLAQLGVALDGQGNVRANTENYQTSLNQVFAAGDMRRGQSLVVWAIREGRQCARAVDEFLMGGSDLAG